MAVSMSSRVFMVIAALPTPIFARLGYFLLRIALITKRGSFQAKVAAHEIKTYRVTNWRRVFLITVDADGINLEGFEGPAPAQFPPRACAVMGADR